MDSFDQETLLGISDTDSPAKSVLEVEKGRVECPQNLLHYYLFIHLETVELVIPLCGEMKLNNSCIFPQCPNLFLLTNTHQCIVQHRT